jgi:hypothetical protein
MMFSQLFPRVISSDKVYLIVQAQNTVMLMMVMLLMMIIVLLVRNP